MAGLLGKHLTAGLSVYIVRSDFNAMENQYSRQSIVEEQSERRLEIYFGGFNLTTKSSMASGLGSLWFRPAN